MLHVCTRGHSGASTWSWARLLPCPITITYGRGGDGGPVTRPIDLMHLQGVLKWPATVRHSGCCTTRARIIRQTIRSTWNFVWPAFSISALDEGQQVGIDDLRMGRAHP